MTPEERDELSRDLAAAGCPELAAVVPHCCEVIQRELRRLLSREVWVVRRRFHNYRVVGTYSTEEHAHRAARPLGFWGADTTQHTIDAEVPGGDG